MVVFLEGRVGVGRVLAGVKVKVLLATYNGKKVSPISANKRRRCIPIEMRAIASGNVDAHTIALSGTTVKVFHATPCDTAFPRRCGIRYVRSKAT